jgi:hypothetical protein
MADFSESLLHMGKISIITQATFPPPQRNLPQDSNIGLLSCNGLELYYFKSSVDFTPGAIYEMLITHLAIPSFFQRVEVTIGKDNAGNTEVTLRDVKDKLHGIPDKNGGYAYNALFATVITETGESTTDKNLVKEINDTYSNTDKTVTPHSHGKYNCGYVIGSDSVGNSISNMVFYFNSYYYIPFLLMNGQTCHFATENESNVTKYISDVEEGKRYVKVDSKIETDGPIGISYALDVSLIF